MNTCLSTGRNFEWGKSSLR